MKRYALLSIVMFSAGSMTAPAYAQVANVSKMALVTCDARVEIKAEASKVWAALTDADKVRSWCPLWKNTAVSKPLTSVGQTVGYEDEYGNKGKSVVLFIERDKELRLAHVPDNGSYVCQVKFTIVPAQDGATVMVTEQYSDDLNVPTDKDTALKTKGAVLEYMALLKQIAEKAKS